jgi:fermentation-respiration switch protein FrsA (DUF1100 family)
LAIDVAGTKANQSCLRAVVADSPFSTFRGIVRDKIAQFWLTWPFQYPLSLLFTAKYNPLDVVAEIAPLPLLIVHGRDDEIVPSYHSELLFAQARPPKQIWIVPHARHTQALRTEPFRSRFLDYLSALP